jgi:dolichol-phosphate mannosyltransferase
VSTSYTRHAEAVTIVVPTYNEADNVPELVDRVKLALLGTESTILFVDDSPDGRTVAAIQMARLEFETPGFSVEHIRGPSKGLSGAVIRGIQHANTAWVVVMDGDLQHTPETIPAMLALLRQGYDLVSASRYCLGGSSDGLSGNVRQAVSTGSNLVSKLLFPKALRRYTDLMTGFFALRRDVIDLECLQPRGFKILLEIIVRHSKKEKSLRVAEVPLVFEERLAGESKGTLREGMNFIRQLTQLRLVSSATNG